MMNGNRFEIVMRKIHTHIKGILDIKIFTNDILQEATFFQSVSHVYFKIIQNS